MEVIRNPSSQSPERFDAAVRSLLEPLSTGIGHDGVDKLKALIDQFGAESYPAANATKGIQFIVNFFNEQLKNPSTQIYNIIIEVVNPAFAENRLSRAVVGDDCVYKLRQVLAKAYEAIDKYVDAARTLDGFQMDSKREDFVAHNVRVADLFLRAVPSSVAVVGPDLQMTMFIEAAFQKANQAAMAMNHTTDDSKKAELKTCIARVYELKQKFDVAALKYINISCLADCSAEARDRAFISSVVCVLQAPVSGQRSRSIEMLRQDERCQNIPVYSFLQKLSSECIIRKADLEPVHKFICDYYGLPADTDLESLRRTSIEHNLLAASKVYENISFDELGRLLHISPEEAERVVANMMTQSDSLINGYIDQVERLVYFNSDEPLANFDAQIEGIFAQVNSVYEKIQQKHPDFVKITQASQMQM